MSFRGAEFSTPTIDALAQSGIILDQYYVQVRLWTHDGIISMTYAIILTAHMLANTGRADDGKVSTSVESSLLTLAHSQSTLVTLTD